jgi:hypothetical protein
METGQSARWAVSNITYITYFINAILSKILLVLQVAGFFYFLLKKEVNTWWRKERLALLLACTMYM